MYSLQENTNLIWTLQLIDKISLTVHVESKWLTEELFRKCPVTVICQYKLSRHDFFDDSSKVSYFKGLNERSNLITNIKFVINARTSWEVFHEQTE